jgi:hypothetical protein
MNGTNNLIWPFATREGVLARHRFFSSQQQSAFKAAAQLIRQRYIARRHAAELLVRSS